MKLFYEAPNGQTIDIYPNPRFTLTGADGLTSATVGIAATELATGDGAIVNNTRTQPRPIVLYITIPQRENVEQVKRDIMTVIKPKQTGVLYWDYQNRTVAINATVEMVSMPRFGVPVVMQISFYCARPYWHDAEYMLQQLSTVLPLHRFDLVIPEKGIVFDAFNIDLTKSFTNKGDATIGCLITIIATGTVTNPLLERSDGLFFGLNVSMESGDEIVINTSKGEKSVTKNGANIIDKIKPGSTWLQLETGENIFTMSESTGKTNMYFTFAYKQEYV